MRSAPAPHLRRSWRAGLALALLSASWVGGAAPSVGHTGPTGGVAHSMVAPDTRLVSVGMDGDPANGWADRPQISKDGRYVVFDSNASNLVPGITTKVRRVYRRDLATGQTAMVSVSGGGTPATKWSSFGWPSADGNLVVFTSDDQALVSPSTVSRSIFVRDMGAGLTELVSTNSAGVRANGPSARPMMSPNGRFVAFNSKATNLSPLGGNGFDQVYVRDRLTGTTTLVSLDATGGLGNATSYRGIVSDDGRFVAFASSATDLVADGGAARESIFLRDLETGQTIRVAKKSNGTPVGGARPYLSPDGNQVVFNTYANITPDDSNGLSDVYVFDRTTGVSSRASVTPTGGNASADSLRGFVTDDHGLVTFNSFAANLSTDDNPSVGDAFLHDMATRANVVVSIGYDGSPADGMSYRPVPSGDGSVITYQSAARNLVAGDLSVGEQVYAVTTETVTPPGGTS